LELFSSARKKGKNCDTIILHIDIPISKTNTIISEINNGHVYDLAHACGGGLNSANVENCKIMFRI
jgi:hypothetical protein